MRWLELLYWALQLVFAPAAHWFAGGALAGAEFDYGGFRRIYHPVVKPFIVGQAIACS